MIQKPNIIFSDRVTISLKDTSPNSHFSQLKINSKNLDSRFCQNKTACGSPKKRTITRVIDVQFGWFKSLTSISQIGLQFP